MNYYIQGDAAKADKIKAAFEKLGYTTPGFNFKSDKGVYYTDKFSKSVDFVSNPAFVELIKTHPDYKELELPVEHEFNVGDWVVFNNSHNSIYQISEIRDSYYILTHTHGGSMSLSFSQEELIRPWTIQDAKDGDVLCTYECGEPKIVFIYKNGTDVFMYYCFYNIMYPRFDANNEPGCLAPKREDVKPATKEQRDLLFDKMKEAGYQWDADKKELHKIKSHYNIANFYAGMPVLVRIDNSHRWSYTLFSHYNEGFNYPFSVASCCIIKQCIPFNDDTKHLLGTTDMPSEEYINW